MIHIWLHLQELRIDMNIDQLWTRWHRFDNKGVKYIRKYNINEIPTPLTEPGYTEWKRGTGPLTNQQYINITTAVRSSHLGVPKSETTKQKMSMAKKGVPKSEEHKQNMRNAWARRKQRSRQNTSV